MLQKIYNEKLYFIGKELKTFDIQMGCHLYYGIYRQLGMPSLNVLKNQTKQFHPLDEVFPKAIYACQAIIICKMTQSSKAIANYPKTAKLKSIKS